MRLAPMSQPDPRHHSVARPAVDDEEFWKGVVPLRFGPLPNLQESVYVVGYPIGGDTVRAGGGPGGGGGAGLGEEGGLDGPCGRLVISAGARDGGSAAACRPQVSRFRAIGRAAGALPAAPCAPPPPLAVTARAAALPCRWCRSPSPRALSPASR